MGMIRTPAVSIDVRYDRYIPIYDVIGQMSRGNETQFHRITAKPWPFLFALPATHSSDPVKKNLTKRAP